MATISKSDRWAGLLLRGSQLRYAAAYLLITSGVLLFLNIYAPITIRNLTYSAQAKAIEDKAKLIVSAFSNYERLDKEIAAASVQSVNGLRATRVLIVDASSHCLYDSVGVGGTEGKLILFPEVTEALRGNDVIHIHYDVNQILSKAGMPIVSYNRIIGAVYLLEQNQDQAALISSLQRNILWISIGLEFLVIIFSILFSTLFSRRMSKLFLSVRKMHDGDYSVRLPQRGHDEVARLGLAFNELAKRLNQSEEVRKQFVSNASHELKTPLASIKLLADSILQNDMDAATTREFVSDIGNEADRLTRLSAKLLELTRLDTQPVEKHEFVHILPVADRVLRMLTPLARKQNIQLKLDCPAECAIEGTADDLYQILFNLVENGIKYNQAGGWVLLQVQQNEGTVQIGVEDTGMGIPDHEKPHIFERFYRVDKARSRKAGGAGLGLSIVHDMVLRNNGIISVEDGKIGGTRFNLSFSAIPGKGKNV